MGRALRIGKTAMRFPLLVLPGRYGRCKQATRQDTAGQQTWHNTSKTISIANALLGISLTRFPVRGGRFPSAGRAPTAQIGGVRHRLRGV